MASLSICHLVVLPWMAILLNFDGIALFEQLIHIARFIKMWVFVRVCVSAYVRVSFNKVEVALHIYFHSLFHIPFNNLYSIHNCLLCKNPRIESFMVIKNEQ